MSSPRLSLSTWACSVVPSKLTSSTPRIRVRSPGSPSSSALIEVAAEVPHRFQRAALDGPAGADDRHPFAQRLGLGEDVAGQQHRRAAVAGLGDALLKDVLHQRVQAAARFVEQQQPGVRRERGDQRDLLPVAFRVGARLLVRVEFEAFDQLGAALLVDAAAHAGQQVDGLAAGQRRPQRDIAWHIGDLAVQARRHRSTGRRRAGAPCRRRRCTRPSRIRMVVDLPGAVGPEEAVHLAFAHRQVEAVERAHRTESSLSVRGSRSRCGVTC